MKNLKTLALTNNDFYPDPDDKIFDLYLRYTPMVNCDLKAIVIDKEGVDPAVLWYKDKN